MRANEFITELKMSPNRLNQFMQTPIAQSMKAGFEAELIFAKLGGGNDPEGMEEPDFDQDENLRDTTTLDEVAEFFHLRSRDYDYKRMLSDYEEWVEEKLDEYREDYFGNYTQEARDDNPELAEREDDGDADATDQLLEIAHDLLSDQWQSRDCPAYGEYVRRNIGHSYSDLAREYQLEWPFMKTAGGEWVESAEEVASYLNMQLKIKPIIGTEHGMVKDNKNWYLEPDSSIDSGGEQFCVEFVSPPMPIMTLLDLLPRIFDRLQAAEAYTNESTGLHIGLSVPNMTKANVDYLKLVMFLGDEYILNQFGRTANTYAGQSLANPDYRLALITPTAMTQYYEQLRQGLLKDASKAFYASNTGKYVTVNLRDNYVEFRSMGGDYLSKAPLVVQTIQRYAMALAIALDPNAERQEYAKRLARFFSRVAPEDSLTPFIQYAARLGTIEAFKKATGDTYQLDSPQAAQTSLKSQLMTKAARRVDPLKPHQSTQ